MQHLEPRLRARPFVLAIAVSAALVLAAPFIGELRRAVLSGFPALFVPLVGAAVLGAIGVAVAATVARIRTRRRLRYAGIALALAIGGTYAYLTRTGDPQVDAVERFHFVEYGLVTFLFYRAWRPLGDFSAIVLPALAGLLVGTVEEWFQWFIPARVGDVRDVFLNGVAIVCGLMFSVAALPPARLTTSMSSASGRRIGSLAAVALVVFAGFFASVHVGYRIAGAGWSFRSCFLPAALEAHAADRTARWRGAVIPRPARLSAEDQYATEGLWHVQRRNRAWDAGDLASAWNENLILERYFAPVLDTPSYVSPSGHRWPADHRADAERRFHDAAPHPAYESDAHPASIYVWPRGVYWMVVMAAAALLVVLTRRAGI